MENSIDSAFLVEIKMEVGKRATTPGQNLINEKLSLVILDVKALAESN